MSGKLPRDTNFVTAVGGESSTTADLVLPLQIDEATGRLLVDATGTLAAQTEDDVHASGDVGAFVLAVRNDTLATLVSADGDYAPLQVDADGALYVNIGSATITVDTEIPAAAALADNTANPTVPSLGAFPHWFDGTTWDRAIGNATDGLTVNLGANNDVVISDGGNVISIDDGAGSITIDGSVSVTGTVTVDSELPAAAALTDNFANPTAPAVGAFGMVWDSATWDRMPGTAADGVLVNLGANNDVTVSGTVAVTQSGTWDEVGINDSGNSITVDNAALSVVGGGLEATALRVTVASDSTGVLSVDDNGSTLSIDDGAGTITVDNAALSVTGGGVEASALRVTIASDSTGVLSIDDNGGTITVDGTVAVSSITTSVTPGTAAANLGKAEDNAHASADTGVYVLAVRDDSLAAHSGTDGDYESLHTTATGALWTSPTGNTTGGQTIFRSIDIDESEEEVKATAGTLYTITAFNTTAAPLYLKFYNATAANVTVGTTTPVLTFVVPGNADSDGAGFVIDLDKGWNFGTAITVAATTGVADNDTGAPGANACIINLGYV